jgi:hypothetical protein
MSDVLETWCWWQQNCVNTVWFGFWCLGMVVVTVTGIMEECCGIPARTALSKLIDGIADKVWQIIKEQSRWDN